MGPTEQILLIGLALVLILASGIPVAFSLAIVGLGAMAIWLPPSQFGALGSVMWEGSSSYVYTAVPLFIFMGEILLRTGASEAAYASLQRWLGRVPGGLGHTNVTSTGLFAAMSGGSSTTIAALGPIAIPAMVSRGYARPLVYGSLSTGAALGILIPPSIPLIVYGSLTGASIGKLFIAALVPGLILILAFMAIVAVWGAIWPHHAPHLDEPFSLRESLRSSVAIAPLIALIGFVLVTIYAGVVTPTEAGAVGAAGSLVIGLLKRELTWDRLWQAAVSAVVLSSMILLILVGAAILNYTVTLLRLPQLVVESVVESAIAPGIVLAAVYLLYLVLGMFFDAISMMVMTLPFVVPLVVEVLGLDLVWFGIVLVLLMEIGLLTPPVGLNIFMIRGVDRSASTADIVKGELPFIAAMGLVIGLVTALPGIVTWLPSLGG